MKTSDIPLGWAPVADLAKLFHCSIKAIKDWGSVGSYGYRQFGPKVYIVNVAEAVAFFRKKYPRIELDADLVDSLMQAVA